MVFEVDHISPREVRLSWGAISELSKNEEVLSYEVRIVAPCQARNKSQTPEPNSPEACFQAAGALADFALSVPGNTTSVVVDGLGE